jgi:hypothetical protein
MEKILAMPSGNYHTFSRPNLPFLFVMTAPALQLILIPPSTVRISFRNLLFLNAVTIKHPSK